MKLRPSQQLKAARQLLHLESRALLLVKSLQLPDAPPRFPSVSQTGSTGQTPGRQRLVRHEQDRFHLGQQTIAGRQTLSG